MAFDVYAFESFQNILPGRMPLMRRTAKQESLSALYERVNSIDPLFALKTAKVLIITRSVRLQNKTVDIDGIVVIAVIAWAPLGNVLTKR